MSQLYGWLNRWRARLPPEAVQDLMMSLGLSHPHAPVVDPNQHKPGSEARQQSLVRIDAAKQGVLLTRNNVGALMDKRGVPVRYGLFNESPAQNEKFKSGDLIGLKKRTIVPADVGSVIGQFVMRECKEEGWIFTGTEHEVAQLACIELINVYGGDAKFTTGKFG